MCRSKWYESICQETENCSVRLRDDRPYACCTLCPDCGQHIKFPHWDDHLCHQKAKRMGWTYEK